MSISTTRRDASDVRDMRLTRSLAGYRLHAYLLSLGTGRKERIGEGAISLIRGANVLILVF